jgi:phospholipase A1
MHGKGWRTPRRMPPPLRSPTMSALRRNELTGNLQYGTITTKSDFAKKVVLKRLFCFIDRLLLYTLHRASHLHLAGHLCFLAQGHPCALFPLRSAILSMRASVRLLLLASLPGVSFPAHAGELEQQLLHCAVLSDAGARLACFDVLAKASGAPEIAAPATPASAGPASAAVPEVAEVAEAPVSRTVQRWELDETARHGIFNFRPHRDNYLLFANFSNRINDQSFDDATAGTAPAKHVELNYQLSFKVKLAEQPAQLPLDLWFGYTQQSFWQAYNRAASSPFRETNYQPEMMAVLPLDRNFAGFDLRYLNFGLVHQSNGQSGTLSRSWNRTYLELGAEHGRLAIAGRIWQRLDNAKSDNDNPDITDYMGHGDLRASYVAGGSEYSIIARRNFSTGHGAIQAAWAFPLASHLKGYVQVFSGYGQSLIDYNFSQKSLGLGILVGF